MICDECGVNDATIKLMTISGGEKRERHLCTECMAKAKKQFGALDLSSLAGLIGGLLQAVKQQDDGEPPEAELDLVCADCGQTYEEFRETGFLGCHACYEAFRAPLETTLKRIHGQTQHNGRVPGGSSSNLSIRLEMERLKQRLGRAIAEEAYEEAARLRDQIRALKSKLEAVPAAGEVDT